MIYEVKLSVHKLAAGKFAHWLPEHVKQVLACPGMKQARIYRGEGETPAGFPSAESKSQADHVIWTVQYDVESADALEVYLKDYSPGLRAKTEAEFGDQVSGTRRSFEAVQWISKPVPESGLPMTDFPKVSCPFIRKTIPIDHGQWKKFGKKHQLRTPEVYLAVDEVNPGYEWVFEDPDTFAVEKLHGTNVKILLEGGRLQAIQNRKNLVDPLLVSKGQNFIMEGILTSAGRDWVPLDGEHAGELIGPKLQGNPYQLEAHEWFPFERTISDLRYRSFDEHERNYDNWSKWFKDHLISRLATKRASKKKSREGSEAGDPKGTGSPAVQIFAEGVIFYNLKRKAEQKTWMAKLRRDMFPWFYEGIDIPFQPR